MTNASALARAEAALLERKRRRRFFPREMFGEIGWDMLLLLYVTDSSGERQTIGRLAKYVGAPHTNALRWISYLETEHLVGKTPHPNDACIVFVQLLKKGRDLLDEYFSTGADSSSSL